jgi:ABC-2 type transport system permease protein
MFSRIWNLVHKEFIQLFRDRLLAPLVLFGPLAELLLIAWSTSQGIDHMPTAVLDMDNSESSRALIIAMENSETYDTYMVRSLDELSEEIGSSRAMAAWVIQPGFENQLLRSGVEPASLQLIVDGSDVLTAQTAVEVGQGLVASFGAQYSTAGVTGLQSVQIAASGELPIDMSLRVWFNEEMKESNYMIPSELGFIAAAITAMIASMAIAKEREMGTLEQLMITPIRSTELVIGKSVMAVTMGFTLFVLMFGMVVLWFGVPMRGSLSLMLILALIYMLVELGWGLMISSFAKSQMQALLIAFAVIMVMVIFSGYAFPVETMPPFMQIIANFFPLKHWLIVFRSIMLKGVGLDVIWPELLAILALGIVIYTGTILLLRRKKLE